MSVNVIRIDTPDDLDTALQALKDGGQPAVLVGLDREGTRFLAYGWVHRRSVTARPGWSLTAVTRSQLPDGELELLPLNLLAFPVVVI